MFRLSLRNLLVNKLRLLLTLASVTVGVAFVSGTFVLSDTMVKAIDELYTGLTSGTDVVVKDAASMPGANEGIEGSSDSGCSCRTASTTASGSRWAWGGAALVLLGLVRRRRSALGKRRGV